MTKRVELTPTQGALTGDLAEPVGTGKVGGIVLIQEWHGVNDYIRAVVDRFAAAGFLTVAPDLYHGKVVTNDADAAALMNGLDFGKAVGEIGAATRALKENPRSNGKVAVLGFCMGGALSLASACNVPGLAAVVAFYGTPDVDQLDLKKITAPVLAHFAKNDDWAKPEKAELIKQRMDALGKPMELHVYDAGHAFMRDTDPTKYAPEASTEAWARTIAFLETHIGQ